MINKFIHIKYSYELIRSMLSGLLPGLVTVNFIAPFMILYIVHDFISTKILLVWMGFHVLIFSLRIYARSKLTFYLIVADNVEKINFYLYSTYFLSFLTTLLFGYMIWLSVLLEIDSLHIFLLGVIIFALSSGALSTIGNIYTLYLLFIVPNLLFLITALVYHGGDMFYSFAFAMFVLMIILVGNGYNHYKLLENSVSLNKTFESIYENSGDGVMLFKNNKFLRANKAMLKMFKVDNEKEFLKRNLLNVSPTYQPDGSLSVKKMLSIIQKSSESNYYNFEWVHLDAEGKEFWCDVVLTKITLDGEDLLHGVWRDISERKTFEIEMQKHKNEIERLNATLEEKIKTEVEKNRLKDRQMLHQSRLAQMGEMISMIAHQWRQPLTAIAASSASFGLKARLNKLDKESALKHSKEIAKYSQHLSNTIDDFRNFFKQDKEKEATNYTYIVKSVLSIIQNSLTNKNIELVEELECHDSFISYPNELKQVVINLVKNAEDILLEKKIVDPKIMIKSYIDNGKYILEVSDNAGGIEEEIIDKIFDPYFSTKMRKDGTGLGLYMSKTIVEEHCNGKLTCFNSDEGAVFKIELANA